MDTREHCGSSYEFHYKDICEEINSKYKHIKYLVNDTQILTEQEIIKYIFDNNSQLRTKQDIYKQLKLLKLKPIVNLK